MGNNVAVRVEGAVLIVVHNDRPPADDEWELYVTALRENAARVRFQLVWSTGGGPNAAQRKRANSAEPAYKAAGRPLPLTAVVTPSAAVRGLVTLFNWFFPNRYRAFDPLDVRAALAFIEVPPAAVEGMIGTVALLCKQVGASVAPR
jgi:hypothetical protein